MEDFKVSARKYRPASFDMVVGQETITNTLKNAIRNKHLAQAYLFCGPRGVGKTTCARIFAKSINCTNPREDAEPCNECESCKSFNDHRSFNIHELDAASNNKADDIRSLTEQVRIPPQIGRYSVYIIDEVHMLSSTAFNAFLKTLEEPPAHAVFILATTEKHKIIPTILSRCQIYDFSRIKTDDIVSRLKFVAQNESINADDEALHTVAAKSDGALRDALSIFDQLVSLCGTTITYRNVIENLNVLDYEYYFRIINGAINGDISSVLLLFNDILEKGFDGHNFISGLNSHIRNLLVCKDAATVKLLEAAPAVKKQYLGQTAECPVVFLLNALETGNTCDLNYKLSKNARLHVELALIKICKIQAECSEKKKPDVKTVQGEENTAEAAASPQPVKNENAAPAENIPENRQPARTEKPAKTFSIKNLMNSNAEVAPVNAGAGVKNDTQEEKTPDTGKTELTEAGLNAAWNEFTGKLAGEGTRIVSMLKTTRIEMPDNKTVRLYLDNTDQEDTFIHNYRQRLAAFLERKFILNDVEIETVVEQAGQGNMLYSDEQKYSYLASRYPMLQDMKRTFGLDIN
ncbi:MAG: DNA polymerase III subunit gamma/tau [Bacteroidales bacterium]|jgi:DNA polymerase-3 subunit gamma/tau|nr:DNA polymerase III subunit gamma/tau [Bacteroidales bacterium]